MPPKQRQSQQLQQPQQTRINALQIHSQVQMDEPELVRRVIAYVEALYRMEGSTAMHSFVKIVQEMAQQLGMATTNFQVLLIWISRFNKAFTGALRSALDSFVSENTLGDEPMFKQRFHGVVAKKTTFLDVIKLKENLIAECEGFQIQTTQNQDKCMLFLIKFIEEYNYSGVISRGEKDDEIERLERPIALSNITMINQGSLSLFNLRTAGLYISNTVQSFITSAISNPMNAIQTINNVQNVASTVRGLIGNNANIGAATPAANG